MAATAIGAAPASAQAAAFVRVDQLGYAPGEAKIAYVLGGSARRFDVIDAAGQVIFTGAAGPDRGRWNARFAGVRALDLSALRTPGTYRVRAGGATSPPFQIADPGALLTPRVADTVAFFQAQRDGAQVIPTVLDRRPAHLHDAHAAVYADPRYESADSDAIVGRSLRRIGGPVDVEGGWFDAGDFIKFTHTTAYADALLWLARRTLGPAAPPALEPEARFGLAWLAKTWRAGSMILQVGIGSGNTAHTFDGDHDRWRLPQVDDGLSGARARYLRDRPAFRANAPGMPLPPNLAGRVAAAFALAAQVDAAAAPDRARAELATAAEVFAAAKTAHVRPADVRTALPHAFYPESEWRDDLELGGAELALAGQSLADPRAGEWLAAARRWVHRGRDTLNLYDVSGLADAELARALHGAGAEAPLADLRAQLTRAAARAARDPFGAAVVYDDFDAASHAFGIAATAALYAAVTGDHRFDALGTAQRDWALGANAWGASLMIGVGTGYPRCPQHVVANLTGALLRGAVVNGPNDAGLFADGLGDFFSNARACSRPYARFTGHGSRYVDDVRAWQTVEPALDFTATAALAFALEAQPTPGAGAYSPSRCGPMICSSTAAWPM